jgi:flagellar hook-associated protein FlgK
MILLNELMKKIEEKNKNIIKKESENIKKNEKEKKKIKQKLNTEIDNEIDVKKDESGNLIIKNGSIVDIISTYDLYMIRKQVNEAEKELSDLLKKLRSEKKVIEYIAFKFGGVLNPSTLRRFNFPYVEPDDENYVYTYGRIIMELLNGNTESIKNILNYN